MKHNSRDFLKKLDIVLLVVLPVMSMVVAFAIEANFLVNTLLFFGLPSVWFSYRTPNRVGRAVLFSLVLLPIFTLMDYVITLDSGWWDSTMFSTRLFGILPYEDFIWAFLQAYVVVIFYEHFLEKGKHPLISKPFRYLVYVIVILLLAFFTLLIFRHSFLEIPFAYFWVLIFFGILPITCFILKFPGLLKKFLITASYFFYLHVLFEFTALKLGNWKFPGQNYIGTIDFFGHVVPYEEIIAWWLLLAIAVLTYYEFFDDDRK